MTTKKYVKIKKALAALMREFEAVPDGEQKKITRTAMTVTEQR